MANNYTIKQTVDLSNVNQNWNVARHDALMYPGDNLAHTWEVQVKRNGIPVDMSGGNVVGYFQRKDGNTVMVNGTITDSVCKVTLAQECYAISGAMRAVMRYTNTSTNIIITLAYHAFTVQSRIDDGGIIDPGEVIPSIDDLLAEIEAMEEATAAAEAAADAVPDMVAPVFSTSTAYSAGSYIYYDGALYRFTSDHAAGAWNSAQAVAVTVGGEVADLKSQIEEMPTVMGSDATGVDFDISDRYGNVIGRFKDGHFQTKEFDSADVVTAVSALTASVKKIEDGYEDISATITYDSSATNTITIEDTFKKGEEIWFHFDDGLKPWENGKRASYYEGNTAIASNRRGTNGYFRHVINAGCSSVKVTIASGEYDNGTSLTLHVYRITGEIKPKIVTVKADGTGMFSTIRGAIDSITDADHLVNPYVIEVYPGTYNTLAGYSDEEIEAAGDVEHYTQTSMVGPKLTDGISMKGIGRAEEIVLTAELSTGTWSSDVRGNISTLNLQGECSLENMTIIGKYIRYCVHDDFGAPGNSHDKRILRNLIFKGTQLSYYPIMTTYGAGMSWPRDYLIENCDFGYDLGIHSSSGYTYGCTIEVNNCAGFRFRIGDRASASGDAFNRVILNNCDFQVINIAHSDNTLASHMQLIGTGCKNSMVGDASGSLYRLGMIDLFPAGLTTGALVKRKSSDFEVEATSDPAVAIGIVIGSDSSYSYVQTTGYIASNYIGLTGLSVGDYVTVDSSTHLIIAGGTAANAIGIVEAVNSNGIAYIKMLI